MREISEEETALAKEVNACMFGHYKVRAAVHAGSMHSFLSDSSLSTPLAARAITFYQPAPVNRSTFGVKRK